MTVTSAILLLLATAAGGVYAYNALTGPYIDPSVRDRFKPFNPNMMVDEISFHNDPKVNKAWWDNQNRRRDGKHESPTARNYDRTW